LHQRPEHQALGIHQQMALTPIYSLGPVIALGTAYGGGFDRLAIENGCPRLRIPPGLDPDGRMQRLVERIPADLQPPEAKVVVHGFPRWQIMGRQSPGTATAEHIKNSLEEFTDRMASGSPAPLGQRQMRRETAPLGGSNISWGS
jgi:hypothetical protein